MEKAKVLVIDDDIKIGAMIKEVLGKQHEVRAVSSVKAAFEEMKRGFSPKIAIVDYMMPDATGDEFVKRVPPEACSHIVITAALVDAEFTTRMMQLGAMYVLQKPFSVVELKAMVKRALER